MRNRGWGEKGGSYFSGGKCISWERGILKTIGGHWCLGKEDLQKRSRWTLLDSDGLRNLRRFLGDGPVRESWHGIEIGWCELGLWERKIRATGVLYAFMTWSVWWSIWDLNQAEHFLQYEHFDQFMFCSGAKEAFSTEGWRFGECPRRSVAGAWSSVGALGC